MSATEALQRMKENDRILGWASGGFIATSEGVFYACSEPGCCDDEMTEAEFLERHKDTAFEIPKK